jgi:hypothetical protein
MSANRILRDLLITFIKMIKVELICSDSLEFLNLLRKNLSSKIIVMQVLIEREEPPKKMLLNENKKSLEK